MKRKGGNKMAKREKISEERKKFLKEFIEQNNITTARDIQEALKDMFKDTLQEMLEAELTSQIGHEKYEYTENEKENYRNGYSSKKIHSSAGDFRINVPRDRNGEFEPVIVEKGSNDISDIEQKIIRMYARGNSNKEIYEQMKELYGVHISPDMVTSITNKVIPKIRDWQNRPLEEVYPVIFVDATYFNVKVEQSIVKKAVYIILGINLAGQKEVLGFYVSEVESAKQWANILNNIKNRGVKDILILCADGLSGLKEAIEVIYPKVEFQRCIVHMIRNTTAFVSYKERKELCEDLKTIYTASNADIAYGNLLELQEKWEKRKVSLNNWVKNWDAIIPFFKFGPELRKIMYTTNTIESLNNSYKRINKGRRVFPSETSLEKSLYLATEIITERWTQQYRNWGVILGELRLHYGDRIPNSINV